VKLMNKQRDAKGQSGFSLIEVVLVVAIIMLVMGMAVVNMNSMLPNMRANSGLSVVMSQLRQGRDMAIANRRTIQIQFVGNNSIRLTRINIGLVPPTVLSTIALEGSMRFVVYPNVPDTPDGFGKAAAVNFGGTPTTFFQSDGSFIDALGNPVNGTVFIGIPNQSSTARAATIVGATGRVRGYRWNGTNWSE